MDGSRFDGLTMLIGGARNRRTVIRLLAGGFAAATGLAGAPSATAARICRDTGEICRKPGDCCSDSCAAPDATGRRRCSACPSADGYSEGDMVCASDLGFCTVTQGVMVYSACAPGTRCVESNGGVLCDWPS